MKVIVAGGGAVGKSIARKLLSHKDHDITIIDLETREDQNNLPKKINWITGDVCIPSTMQLANALDADIFVAATGDDQINLVASMIAKTEYGITKVIARVNHPKNESLFGDSWGVDLMVSTPKIISQVIENTITLDEFVPIYAFPNGKSELLKLSISENSELVGKTLTEFKQNKNTNDGLFNSNFIVCAVNRDKIAYDANSELLLSPGDEIIVLSHK